MGAAWTEEDVSRDELRDWISEGRRQASDRVRREVCSRLYAESWGVRRLGFVLWHRQPARGAAIATDGEERHEDLDRLFVALDGVLEVAHGGAAGGRRYTFRGP